MYTPNQFSPSSFTPTSMMGMMSNLGDAKGKSAAVRAAVIATIMGLLYILFYLWPLSPEMGKLVRDIAGDAKTTSIISQGIILAVNALGLYLAKCVIGMTGNTPGRWAGSILSIMRTIGVISAGTIFSLLISGTNVSSDNIFLKEWFNVAYNVVVCVAFILAGCFFIKAVRGGAGVMLALGYFVFGFAQLVLFLVVRLSLIDRYDDMVTLSRIVDVVCILAAIIIVIGYYMNIRNYKNQEAQQPQQYAQQPYGQPQYGQPYQQPYGQQPQYGQPYQQPQQSPYQQPQQSPYQQPQQPPYQQPQQPPYQQPQQPQQPPYQRPYPPQQPQQPGQSGRPMPPPVPPQP